MKLNLESFRSSVWDAVSNDTSTKEQTREEEEETLRVFLQDLSWECARQRAEFLGVELEEIPKTPEFVATITYVDALAGYKNQHLLESHAHLKLCMHFKRCYENKAHDRSVRPYVIKPCGGFFSLGRRY